MTYNNSTHILAPKADVDSVKNDMHTVKLAMKIDEVSHILPSYFIVLNKHRQIVYTNKLMLELLNIKNDDDYLGKRPGEFFNCHNSNLDHGGCGTSENCQECGALRAILNSKNLNTGSINEECRITTYSGEAYEFSVWASPYSFNSNKFTIFSLVDISDQKRKEALENTFFHDINNLLSVLLGFTEIAELSDDLEKIKSHVSKIKETSEELIEEVSSHRILLKAENNELLLNMENHISLSSIVGRAIEIISATFPNIKFKSNHDYKDIILKTDRTLLFRIIYNMLKNAAEASEDAGVISLEFKQLSSKTIFKVHNQGFIPYHIQHQIFQRSFSTKGKGRGIGTYSMKLFGEKYLKGEVKVTSSHKNGTTFSISLPN